MTKRPQEFEPTATVGALIRRARERKGISRKKLAEFAAISPNSMVKYEKAGEDGGKYPSLVNATKICEILEIDPRKLFQKIIETEISPATSIEDAMEQFSFVNYFNTDMDWFKRQAVCEDGRRDE